MHWLLAPTLRLMLWRIPACTMACSSFCHTEHMYMHEYIYVSKWMSRFPLAFTPSSDLYLALANKSPRNCLALISPHSDAHIYSEIISIGWMRKPHWHEIGMTNWPSNEWNDPILKRIWRWNDGMKPNYRVFRIKGFALDKKTPFIWPHSVIPTSFSNEGMKWKWPEWMLNANFPL